MICNGHQIVSDFDIIKLTNKQRQPYLRRVYCVSYLQDEIPQACNDSTWHP
jgi:hypothetical protein